MPTVEQIVSDPEFSKFKPKDQVEIIRRLKGDDAAQAFQMGPAKGPNADLINEGKNPSWIPDVRNIGPSNAPTSIGPAPANPGVWDQIRNAVAEYAANKREE